MTPDSIRRIQEGKVFDYTEPPPKPLVDPVRQILEEQHQEELATGKQGATKKVKAGRTVIEVPAATSASPQTNLVALQDRPKVNFEELVQWILAHPGATHGEIGQAYGRPAGWFSTVLVMAEFQAALDPFRGEIQDPAIIATIEERLQALMLRSVDVLQAKMSVASPGDALVLEAAKIGVRALGLGNAGREGPAQAAPQSLEAMADRLTALVVNRQRGAGIGQVPGKATELVEDVTPKGE